MFIDTKVGYLIDGYILPRGIRPHIYSKINNLLNSAHVTTESCTSGTLEENA